MCLCVLVLVVIRAIVFCIRYTQRFTLLKLNKSTRKQNVTDCNFDHTAVEILHENGDELH